MDLISIIRDKIDRAGNGDFAPGLRAVLLHIETAEAHLDRGQDTSDETAFTDVIYRTNQAFEGSLKEAYRVLAGKTPGRKTPNEIEEYLTTNNLFRSRVLAQLKTYRTEWRNPSTHDYKLDFDMSEAFLSIVTVCAFASLMLDQIVEKVARDHACVEANSKKEALEKDLKKYDHDLALLVASIIVDFLTKYQPKHEGPRMREAELLGALAGFIESIDPKINVGIDMPLVEKGRASVDLLLQRGDAKILLELKGMRFSKSLVRDGLDQLDRYMTLSSIETGIILLFRPPVEALVISDVVTPQGRRAVIIAPETITT